MQKFRLKIVLMDTAYPGCRQDRHFYYGKKLNNFGSLIYLNQGAKTCFHSFNMYIIVIFMYITTFGRSVVVLRTLCAVQPQTAWMPAESQTAMEG